uniref:Uncharacterized protein n=1 Tax=Physcomitrium patens TaxID=3218 RepID=A0A7I4FTP5_PHYPA
MHDDDERVVFEAAEGEEVKFQATSY